MKPKITTKLKVLLVLLALANITGIIAPIIIGAMIDNSLRGDTYEERQAGGLAYIVLIPFILLGIVTLIVNVIAIPKIIKHYYLSKLSLWVARITIVISVILLALVLLSLTISP